ncbi:MAG TPA: hypothetical protein PKA90_13370 [Ignavibacteria bacterium]|nr:hypothetical protein [Ignavibacteria bacterium]HMR41409.1 hypothetical protein [Ignavibacteria bacterium]
MRILIDESLDVRMKKYFGDFETYTVKYMEWLGIKNGKLLNLHRKMVLLFLSQQIRI